MSIAMSNISFTCQMCQLDCMQSINNKTFKLILFSVPNHPTTKSAFCKGISNQTTLSMSSCQHSNDLK